VLTAVIDFSLRHRVLVLVAACALILGGVWSLSVLDIDAFPDTTPVQVQINAPAPALAPEEVEKRITFIIEQQLSGLPGLVQLRSVSKFGLSQVVATFKDGTDIYFARQIVNERLGSAELPPGVERPRLGPVSTGLGEVFHYIVTARDYDFSTLSAAEKVDKLTRLRTLHDTVVRPQLRSLPGVAEVNSWGGYEKQYHVRLDPLRLIKHDLTFEEVVKKLKEDSNFNVGGGSVQQQGQMFLVHGQGRASTAQDVRAIVLVARDGVPIKLGDVAEVTIGHEIRRGAVSFDGRGEAILGLGFSLMGENTREVTTTLRRKLHAIQAGLPADVEVQVVYDRTELIQYVIDTVRRNLFEGGLLVVAVLFAFLGGMRAACIVALAIPLSMLFAFSGMLRFGIAASLLSLGAIDFGLVVDSSVVLIENCVRRLGQDGDRDTLIRDAAVEVRGPTLFGELIILIVYLPILTLEGIEGKLFRPMALTVIFAIFGSMILSLTLMPVLASLLLPGRKEPHEPLLMRLAHALHAPVLKLCMEYRFVVVGMAVGVLIVAFGMIAPHLGREFVPRLSEGAIAIGVVRLAGTDLEESIQLNTRMEKLIKENFPDEVQHVWSRIGTAEIATDPMGVELTDLFITLKDRSRWKKVRTQEELVEQLNRILRELPGQRMAFSQPIEMRMNEMISGSRSDLAVMVFGDDLEVLKARAQEIEKLLQTIPGAADVSVEQVTGQPVLQVKVEAESLARYGVSARTVLEMVEAVGGKPVGEVVEEPGALRFPLVVRLPETWRKGPDALKALLVPTPVGERIPLGRLARVEVVEGPSTITREWGQRRITVSVNVRNRDLGSFVAEAQEKVQRQVTLPSPRYRIGWGGQFEHYERARNRLMLVVPLAVVLVFVLLLLTYRNVVDALRVFTGVPFGWVGGLFALWLRDMPFSISAAVGFIALSGVAVLDDMILVSYVRQLRRRGLSVDEAVRQAAITRLRPVLMTTLVASLGFLPMALSTGVGAEVQRPLATVVIGGVIGAMVMSLLVLRVLYLGFDTLASLFAALLQRMFGLQADQLTWLVGQSANGAVQGDER
jgi:cobalt-zinc-cadmium resistance protein CzcA